MRVTVDRISIPAMSTIGRGWGTSEAGERVQFAGDHRPMRDIGEAIATANSRDELPEVELEDWQLLSVEPIPEGEQRALDGNR